MVVNGMLLLAIWFLLWGLSTVFPVRQEFRYVLGVLAVIVGVMLLVGR